MPLGIPCNGPAGYSGALKGRGCVLLLAFQTDSLRMRVRSLDPAVAYFMFFAGSRRWHALPCGIFRPIAAAEFYDQWVQHLWMYGEPSGPRCAWQFPAKVVWQRTLCSCSRSFSLLRMLCYFGLAA